MATVEYRNICKEFADGTVGLRDLDLKIDDGEFVVLVGPSGCGKSTALRLLAGLEDVSQGEILLNGEVVNHCTPQQRNIAMVFQNYALYPHMSVRGNLDFPLKMLHRSKKERAAKIAEIAEMLNLKDQLDRKPAQLSGGQRQRVAMGRALVRDPSVFLLDEPLSNLDAKQRAHIRAEIANLQKQLRKTTLYVTHDQVEAMTLGDRVAVLDRGKLHQVGAPLELYNTPLSTFVAEFIGSPGMNILPVQLLPHMDNQWQIRIGDELIVLPDEKIPQSCFILENQLMQVGFRPESIQTKPIGSSFKCSAAVESTEFLGHETLVYFQLPNSDSPKTLIARLPGQFRPAAKTIEFFLSPANLYLFNADGTALKQQST